jgi:hypothetical protein
MTLDSRIRGLLDMAPSGLTDGQLLWRLKSGGVRHDASDLLAALNRLSQSGLVRAERGRWHAARSGQPDRTTAKGAASSNPPGGLGQSGDRLHAAPARVGSIDLPPATSLSDLDQAAGAAPDAAALLRYYAATQRRDPRGSVEAFPDEHGVKWHLFDARGARWEGQEVAIAVGLLQPGFRQALAEAGPTGAAAVGWPMCVVRDPTGLMCLLTCSPETSAV